MPFGATSLPSVPRRGSIWTWYLRDTRPMLPWSMMNALRACCVYLGEWNVRKYFTPVPQHNRALRGCGLQLVESASDDDVVIRPTRDDARGYTLWPLMGERTPQGLTVAKMRLTAVASETGEQHLGVHPGREWFTVLSGTVHLQLGERAIQVNAGEAAEFSTMLPHAVYAVDAPAELLIILTRDGEAAHLFNRVGSSQH